MTAEEVRTRFAERIKQLIEKLGVAHESGGVADDRWYWLAPKLQGQQAEVVLISMVTSSGDDLPRDIEFLYSKNRLNVTISRARSLACIVASPRLLQIQCNTVEQLQLVNTLCWAQQYAESLKRM